MSQIVLLPCPFCGGEAALNTVQYSLVTVQERGWVQSTFHGANCISCGVDNKGLVGAITPEDAADRWNRRASR